MKYSIALTKHFDERERLFDLLINDEILINYNPVSIICMDINKVPDFLNNAINEIDYDVIDYSRISFGEYELDGEILVPEGMVGFSIFDDITLLSKNEFYSLCH